MIIHDPSASNILWWQGSFLTNLICRYVRTWEGSLGLGHKSLHKSSDVAMWQSCLPVESPVITGHSECIHFHHTCDCIWLIWEPSTFWQAFGAQNQWPPFKPFRSVLPTFAIHREKGGVIMDISALLGLLQIHFEVYSSVDPRHVIEPLVEVRLVGPKWSWDCLLVTKVGEAGGLEVEAQQKPSKTKDVIKRNCFPGCRRVKKRSAKKKEHMQKTACNFQLPKDYFSDDSRKSLETPCLNGPGTAVDRPWRPQKIEEFKQEKNMAWTSWIFTHMWRSSSKHTWN